MFYIMRNYYLLKKAYIVNLYLILKKKKKKKKKVLYINILRGFKKLVILLENVKNTSKLIR